MNDAPHPQLLRGLQLKELGRYTDAESAFREALAQEPNDAFALHQLAGCQWQIPGRHKDALETINQAITVEPNESEHHVLRAFILCVLDRPKEALAAARTALGFAPNDTSAFAAEAQAHLQMESWALAEQAARQSLALDADNSVAANQLAQALRLQNKQAENAAHLAGMLARDPDDAFTHANAGWAALQRGEHREAEVHFREALRLDPDFDYAREGLLNSFRARSPIYRAYLKYSFAMQRLSQGARWAVIIGLYLAVKFAGRLPGGFVLVALYFLFVLWVWVARGVGNFILLFDRFARYALRPREKTEAVAVGGGLCLGLVLLGLGVAFSPMTLVLGLGLVAAVFPLSMTFTNESKIGTWLFGSIAAVTLGAAILTSLSDFIPVLKPSFQVFGIGAFGCLASTWLGNIRALNRR